MKFSPLLVSCDLAGPLAGDPPALEALLLDRAVVLRGDWRRVTRDGPPPPQGEIPLPVGATWLGGWLVYHCSAPILSEAAFDAARHHHQRYPVERADWLDPAERTQVNTTGGAFKSYRLPNRVRGVRTVCWVAEGNWREMRKLLRDVTHLGKDRAQGYGAVRRADADADASGRRVSEWRAEERPDLAGCWWYARREAGELVLMRALPAGPWLPAGLAGARREYAAVAPPCWHPARQAEAVVPC